MKRVAYFCAEYAIDERLRLYSGGLGVLAGDHLRSASELGIPLVAIGLFYRQGFFTQAIDEAGQQDVIAAQNDPEALGLTRVCDAGGAPVRVTIELADRTIHAGAWEHRIAEVRLLLLDTDVDGNAEPERGITRRLYLSAASDRILQEIVLGIGGELLLHALGLAPQVFHLNEGHAAFVGLARAARLVAGGSSFAAARDQVRASTLFTTHTPVPAGHDRFELELLERHFGHAPKWLGLSFAELAALGSAGDDASFNMTYLALRLAGRVNGVSRRHAEVSRELLAPAWDEGDGEIAAITNGVHLPTWTSKDVVETLEIPGARIRGQDFVDCVDRVKTRALWNLRARARERMVEALRARGLPAADSDALWIGFARRFAGYKRATLLFSDLARLERLLDDTLNAVRLVIAGKVHPADELGQKLLTQVVELSHSSRFEGRILFVPNYELDVARELVAGVDVWLNTPVRGKEASGTSGMKAAANGALNLSIADGWWLEGADGDNGWTIGPDEPFDNRDAEDEHDTRKLYELLESEIVPMFYDWDHEGIPQQWVARIRASMRTIPVQFDSERMLRDYVKLYDALG